MSINITGLIITVNEEKYIERAITNLLPYMNEIVVLDGGSTDKTVEISQRLGARVHFDPWEFDFAKQRNNAHEYVRTEWITWLDADEFYDDSFFKVIENYCKNPMIGAYQINRINDFDGWHSEQDYQWRLMRKSCMWTGGTHTINVVTLLDKDRLPDDIKLYHQHSWKRQNYNNELYNNMNKGVMQYPMGIDKD